MACKQPTGNPAHDTGIRYVIRSLANVKAVEQDEIFELFEIILNGDPAKGQQLLDIVVGISRRERFRNIGKLPLSTCVKCRGISPVVRVSKILLKRVPCRLSDYF